MNKGFTLIELLVTITIIAILAALAFTSFQSAQKNARDGVRRADLGELKRILQQYYSSNKNFPVGGFSSCNTSGAEAWSNLAASLVPAYAQKLPVDPLNTINSYPYIYCYYYNSQTSNIDPSQYNSPNYYTLGVRFELPSSDINYDPGSGCGGYHDISSGLNNFFGACSVNFVIIGP